MFIDHIIIAVRDLEKAAADFALMLGRSPSWRGTHPDYGSANILFRLDNAYVELLAADSTSDKGGWGADMVNSHIDAKGESIAAVIFGTDDADAFVQHARAKGVEITDPQAGHGVDSRTGAKRTWRNMFWPREAARGLFGFCIHHDDPEALPMAAITGDGYCAGLDHVVLQTRDASAAKDFYGEKLGIRLALEQSKPEWGGEMLFFRCNHMSLEVIANDKTPEEDHWWGLALKTDNIEAAHARMADAGISTSEVCAGRKPDTKVMTVKSHCFAVPTLIIEHL